MNIIVLLNISTPVPPHKVKQTLPLPQLSSSVLKLTYQITTSVDNDIPFHPVYHPHTYFLNQSTAAKYAIMSIPTLILFKDGQPATRQVGIPAGSPKANSSSGSPADVRPASFSASCHLAGLVPAIFVLGHRRALVEEAADKPGDDTELPHQAPLRVARCT